MVNKIHFTKGFSFRTRFVVYFIFFSFSFFIHPHSQKKTKQKREISPWWKTWRNPSFGYMYVDQMEWCQRIRIFFQSSSTHDVQSRMIWIWLGCVCVFSFFYWDITAATRMLYDNLWSYSFFDIFIPRRRQRRGVIPSLLVSVASFFKSVLLLKIASWQFFGWCRKRQTIKFIYDSPWNIPTIIGRWRTVMKKNTAKKISLWISWNFIEQRVK